jgi:uncharacterized membrane protein YidH (DUF202 family)
MSPPWVGCTKWSLKGEGRQAFALRVQDMTPQERVSLPWPRGSWALLSIGSALREVVAAVFGTDAACVINVAIEAVSAGCFSAIALGSVYASVRADNSA